MLSILFIIQKHNVMVEINPLVYNDLSEIALKFGPFFFSLIFCLIIVPTSRKWYWTLNRRVDPPPTKNERKTYKSILIGSSIFSIVLISVCVIWWLSIQNSVKVFSGEIQNVNDYIEITSPDVYLKVKKSGNQPYKDVSFVSMYNPDKPPKNLRLYVRKDGSSEYHFFLLNFNPKAASLKYNYIETDTSRYFKTIAQYTNEIQFSLFRSAYAISNKSIVINKFNLTEETKYENNQTNPLNTYLVERLQDESTPVGEKINILNTLLKITDLQLLAEYLSIKTDKEPFIFTLSDLNNHSDKEIAYKSKKILDKVNTVDIVSDLINSSPNPRESADIYLFRISEDVTRKIIGIQPATANWALEYKSQIDSLDYEKLVLYPVGSLKGDRYYVKATWDKNNKEVEENLTLMFNNALLTKRSMNEERKIMEEKSSRIIYWYSKEWAFLMAKTIKTCGGEPSFVKSEEIIIKKKANY